MRGRAPSIESYELRLRYKPVVQGGLSSTVIVEGEGYVDVGFSGRLVGRIGCILPRGISAHDPAYMTLVQRDGVYELYVQYLEDRGRVKRYHVLTMDVRPKWLDRVKKIPTIKEVQNGNNTKDTDPACTG